MSQVRLALISNSVSAHLTFRIPLIRALIAKGVKVFVLAPDFETSNKAIIYDLGAEPVDVSISRVGMNVFTDFFDTFANLPLSTDAARICFRFIFVST